MPREKVWLNYQREILVTIYGVFSSNTSKLLLLKQKGRINILTARDQTNEASPCLAMKPVQVQSSWRASNRCTEEWRYGGARVADAPCVSKHSISSAVSRDTCLPALSGWLSHKHTHIHAHLLNWRWESLELASLILSATTALCSITCPNARSLTDCRLNHLWLNISPFQTEDVLILHYSQMPVKETLRQGKLKTGWGVATGFRSCSPPFWAMQSAG